MNVDWLISYPMSCKYCRRCL